MRVRVGVGLESISSFCLISSYDDTVLMPFVHDFFFLSHTLLACRREYAWPQRFQKQSHFSLDRGCGKNVVDAVGSGLFWVIVSLF